MGRPPAEAPVEQDGPPRVVPPARPGVAGAGTGEASGGADAVSQPSASAETAYEARIRQLEQLREQPALDTDGHILAALAWLALHQAHDGRISDPGVRARCRELGHNPPCAYTGAPCCGDDETCDMVETSLAVLALLDVRDPRSRALLQPTLDRAIAWLLGQQLEDGSFGTLGLTARERKLVPWSFKAARPAFPVRALARAAAATDDDELREAARRGVKSLLLQQRPDGGFGSGRDTPIARPAAAQPRDADSSDIQTTMWVALAIEAAGSTGLKVPVAAQEGLRGFADAIWSGARKLSLDGGEARWLYPVGTVLAIAIRWEPTSEVLDEWRAWVGKRPPMGCYERYLGVRIATFLAPELPNAWKLVLAHEEERQQTDGEASGAFDRGFRMPSGVSGSVLATCVTILTLQRAR